MAICSLDHVIGGASSDMRTPSVLSWRRKPSARSLDVISQIVD